MDKNFTEKKRRVVGRTIKRIRHIQGDLTQQQVSQALGHNSPFFQQRIEAGTRRLDIVELSDLCKVLNISLREMAGYIEDALSKIEN